MILTMICIAAILLIGYLVAVRVIFGEFPPSYSATHYWFKVRGFNCPFKTLMYTLPCLLCPAWFQIADSINSYWTFLAFLSGVCLAGVGLYANYLGEDRRRHIVFTTIAASLSALWTFLIGYGIITLIIYGIILIYLGLRVLINYDKGISFNDNLVKAKTLLWIEIAAFSLIIVPLIINAL